MRKKPSGEGNKRRQMLHVKGRHIATNPLPPFVSAVNAAYFVGRMAKGMVSSIHCLPADEGEATARNSPWSDVGRCSVHIIAQSRGAVRVNQRPIICRRSARQCIARLIRLRSTLHPPPGSGDFAFRISRTEDYFTKVIEAMAGIVLNGVIPVRLSRRVLELINSIVGSVGSQGQRLRVLSIKSVTTCKTTSR